MKLQSFSIVFALIILPLFLVLTYYIQLQVDTITLQNQYDTKLLTATYDAMSSFEMNTANEDLSSVSDALRTIIEASNNVFFNTLSTNLGLSNASKSFVEPYIPAILYTLYDGYYIAAPTSVPDILTKKVVAGAVNNNQGVAVAVGDEGIISSEANPGYYKYIYDEEKAGHDRVVEYTTGMEDYGQILFVAKDKTNPTEILKEAGEELYTTDPSKAILKTKTVLKSYMPYSARYTRTDESDGSLLFDITVIYTLDNFITIEGKAKAKDSNHIVNYSKSGYLIDTNNIVFEDASSVVNNGKVIVSERKIQEYIESGGKITVKIKNYKKTPTDPDKYTYIRSEGRSKEELENDMTFLTNQIEDCELNKDLSDPDIPVGTIVNKIKERYPLNQLNPANVTYQDIISECNQRKNDIQYELDKMSAAVYYAKASVFTSWVSNTFGEGGYKVLEKDIKQISGVIDFTIENNGFLKSDGLYSFDGDGCIFNVEGSGSNNKYGSVEIDVDSTFYSHKLNVIVNSIQYNLNLAMTSYSYYSEFDYSMPIISGSEWDKILTNPSVVAFMQGLNCGLKTYNNYMIASSNNNEISVTPDNIFYVDKTKFNDETSEYHKINCERLVNELEGRTELLSFTSKEIKYDKLYNKTKSTNHYWYDHKNLACYSCINDPNYKSYTGGQEISIFDKNEDPNKENNVLQDLRSGFYIGIGKERNNLYKPNAVVTSQGYEVLYNKPTLTSSDSGSGETAFNASEIDYIEIVFGTIPEPTRDTTTISIEPTNTNMGYFDSGSLNTRQTTNQTRLLYIKDAKELKNNPDDNVVTVDEILNKFKFTRSSVIQELADVNVKKNYIKYIRVIYK